MNTLIMAFKPKWAELIASGKKTIEVRKVLPTRYVKDINNFEQQIDNCQDIINIPVTITHAPQSFCYCEDPNLEV